MRARVIEIDGLNGCVVDVLVREIGVPHVRAMWAARDRLESKPLEEDEAILAGYIAREGLIPSDLSELTDAALEDLYRLSITAITQTLIPACKELNPDFFAERGRVMASALDSP